MNRRNFLKLGLKIAGGLWLLPKFSWAAAQNLFPPAQGIPVRSFGRTGFSATLVGLGGEGVLRTYGRSREAVPLIERALELGINYFDTAPAYSQSQDYYGEVFRAHPEVRERIFLASKTHERSYEGSLKLLKDSLNRLGADHLDLWQLHDLRDQNDLEEIFSPRGAIKALEEAKKKGWVRFLGITGHHDPFILKQAAERFDFDAVLVALNAADLHSHSFIKDFLPAARQKGMGIIGMKVYSRGRILDKRLLTAREALFYVLSLPVSHVILGCDNILQLEENVALAKAFSSLSGEEMKRLEQKTFQYHESLTYYKGR